MDNYLFLPRSIAAAVSDISFALIVGLALASYWLAKSSDERLERSLRRASIMSMAVLLVVLAVQAEQATAVMIGSSEAAPVRAQFVTVITGTHAGRVLMAEFLVGVVLFALLWLSMKRTIAKLGPTFAALILLAAVRAANGHAAGDDNAWLSECVQFVHLTSTAIWAGCIIVAGMIVVPALARIGPLDPIVDFMRRLSRLVTTSLALIVLSGIYNSYRGLGGSIAPLAHTQWGVLLDLKVLLVCVALVMGAFNRRLIRIGHNISSRDGARLAVAVRLEAVVMVLILTISAFLANSPPASS